MMWYYWDIRKKPRKKSLWLIFNSFHVIFDWMDLSATGRVGKSKTTGGNNLSGVYLEFADSQRLEIIDNTVLVYFLLFMLRFL